MSKSPSPLENLAETQRIATRFVETIKPMLAEMRANGKPVPEIDWTSVDSVLNALHAIGYTNTKEKLDDVRWLLEVALGE